MAEKKEGPNMRESRGVANLYSLPCQFLWVRARAFFTPARDFPFSLPSPYLRSPQLLEVQSRESIIRLCPSTQKKSIHPYSNACGILACGRVCFGRANRSFELQLIPTRFIPPLLPPKSARPAIGKARRPYTTPLSSLCSRPRPFPLLAVSPPSSETHIHFSTLFPPSFS